MLYVPHDDLDNNNNIENDNNNNKNEKFEIIFDLNEIIIFLVDHNEINNINNNKLKNSEFKLIEISKLKKTRFNQKKIKRKNINNNNKKLTYDEIAKKFAKKKEREIYNKNKEEFIEQNNNGEKIIVSKVKLTNFLKLIEILKQNKSDHYEKKIQKSFSERRHLLFEKIKKLSLKQIQDLIKKNFFLNKNDNKHLKYIFFENNIDKKKYKELNLLVAELEKQNSENPNHIPFDQELEKKKQEYEKLNQIKNLEDKDNDISESLENSSEESEIEENEDEI
jgi:hypothetical protein